MLYVSSVVYKALGPSASWKRLEGISSSIATLRGLASQINTSLAPHNLSRHTPPKPQADLDAILKSLIAENIHVRDDSRRLGDKISVLRVKDVMAIDLQTLQVPNFPIDKFNKTSFGTRRSVANGTEVSGEIQTMGLEAEEEPPRKSAKSRSCSTISSQMVWDPEVRVDLMRGTN
ncbi:unnamed protein product [Rhizoctonia solani]|uniref:Uncharacterized protein n=1 Tax=Rhizoctonia solani TaxID=456999 RepID=A0A8H2WCF9_9AGAM|nr:unnamed protein product [Rhizoctonia solani]